MKKQHSGNSRLFFIEFLIVLFFFLIISTVCLKMFVKAHQITQHAEDLSHTQTLAASAAELLLAGYDMQEVQEICEAKFECIIDDFSEQEKSETYRLQIAESDETPALAQTQDLSETQDSSETQTPLGFASVRNYCISICKSDAEPIYELTITVHTPLTQEEVLP